MHGLCRRCWSTSNGSAGDDVSVSSRRRFRGRAALASTPPAATSLVRDAVESDTGRRCGHRREVLKAATSRSPPTTTVGTARRPGEPDDLDASVARHQRQHAVTVGRERGGAGAAGSRTSDLAELPSSSGMCRKSTQRGGLDGGREQLRVRAVGPAALVAEIRDAAAIWRKTGRLACPVPSQTPGAPARARTIQTSLSSSDPDHVRGSR